MNPTGRNAAVAAAITAMLLVSACSKTDSSTTATTASGVATSGAPATTKAPGPTTTGGGSTGSTARTPGSSGGTTGSTGGSTGSTPTYGPVDTSINVPVNGRFAIRLESNASTGYTWTYKLTGGKLQLVDQTTEAPGSGAIGAAGAQVFTFEATAPGDSALTFTYARSQPSPDDKTINYAVSITGA